MKIKRFCAAALVLLCLCGCGSTDTGSTDSAVSETQASSATAETEASTPSQEESTSADLAAVYADIKSQVELPDMVDLNDKLLTRYYGLSTDVVAEYAGGVDSSGVGQDEIVLIKAADESNVADIQAALQTRYDSKLAQQENYNADEADKIRKCEVKTNGLYVTLIISNDADSINSIVDGAIG